MIPTLKPSSPSPEPLEIGELAMLSVEDVSLAPKGLGAPQQGRLTITNRYLRFTPTESWTSDLLHGFPDFGSFLRHGASSHLMIPLGDIRKAEPERSLAVFHKLRLTLKNGTELVFHFGARNPAEMLAALGRTA
jgi:hypothetical protein